MALRLAFFGTPDFAVPTLAELIGAGHDIVCVYSQPPRPKGRGQQEQPSPVHRFAAAANIPVRTPRSLKEANEQNDFRALNLDAAVVVAYGLLLPKAILDAPRLGSFNVHASLLPRWRGAAPIQRAIMAGDEMTGVMVMRMEEGLDTGLILMREQIKIDRKNYGELHDELAPLGASLMVRALSAVALGQAIETPQSLNDVTYAAKIKSDEGRIDWSKTVREIDCQIRGLSPIPGAWFEAKGERIKVLAAEPDGGKDSADAVVMNCGDGRLRLLKLQRAGRAPMDAAEFKRGFAL